MSVLCSNGHFPAIRRWNLYSLATQHNGGFTTIDHANSFSTNRSPIRRSWDITDDILRNGSSTTHETPAVLHSRSSHGNTQQAAARMQCNVSRRAAGNYLGHVSIVPYLSTGQGHSRCFVRAMHLQLPRKRTIASWPAPLQDCNALKTASVVTNRGSGRRSLSVPPRSSKVPAPNLKIPTQRKRSPTKNPEVATNDVNTKDVTATTADTRTTARKIIDVIRKVDGFVGTIISPSSIMVNKAAVSKSREADKEVRETDKQVREANEEVRESDKEARGTIHEDTEKFDLALADEKAQKYLLRHHEVHHMIDANWPVIQAFEEEWESLWQHIKEQHLDELRRRRRLAWKKYRKSSTIPTLLAKLNKYTEDVRTLQIEIEELRQLMIERQALLDKENRRTLQNAHRVVKLTKELKKLDGPHNKNRLLLYDIVSGNRCIEQELEPYKIRDIEKELIIKGIWRPQDLRGKLITVQKMKLCHENDGFIFQLVDQREDLLAAWIRTLFNYRYTFAPYEKDERTEAGVDISYSQLAQWGHTYRALDLASQQFDILPEIAYPKYWSAHLMFHLNLPWQNDIWTFHQFVIESTKYWSDKEKLYTELKSTCTSRKSPKLLEYIEMRDRSMKMITLFHQVTTFENLSYDIRFTFKEIIGQGLISLCPTPYPEMHAWQMRNFAAFDAYLREHSEFMRECTYIGSLLKQVDDSPVFDRTSQEGRLGQRLSNRLLDENLVKDGLVWRRELRTIISEVTLYCSAARVVAMRGNLDKTVDFQNSCPSDVFIAQREITTVKNHHGSKALLERSELWLTNQSFYPAHEPIFVDFISSVDALYLIIPEIRQSKVIGIDIISEDDTKRQKWKANQKIRYIIMATERQILIIDMLAVLSNYRLDLKSLLVGIVENESILKISLDWKAAKKALYTYFYLHPVSCIEVSTNDLAFFTKKASRAEMSPILPTIRTAAGLESLRRSRPDQFFYSLVYRSYAALRLFNVISQNSKKPSAMLTLPDLQNQIYQNLATHPLIDHQTATLGPIFVDRSTKSTFKSVRRSIESTALQSIDRKEWIYGISELMMENRFRSASSEEDRKALTAYVLFTTFHESLESIKQILTYAQSSQCAASIIRVAGKYKGDARLNDIDRSRLLMHSIDYNVEYDHEAGASDYDAEATGMETYHPMISKPGRKRPNRIKVAEGERSRPQAQTDASDVTFSDNTDFFNPFTPQASTGHIEDFKMSISTSTSSNDPKIQVKTPPQSRNLLGKSVPDPRTEIASQPTVTATALPIRKVAKLAICKLPSRRIRKVAKVPIRKFPPKRKTSVDKATLTVSDRSRVTKVTMTAIRKVTSSSSPTSGPSQPTGGIHLPVSRGRSQSRPFRRILSPRDPSGAPKVEKRNTAAGQE